MRGFFVGIFLTIVGGMGAAALVEAVPVAPVRVMATLALGACVYFAARSGAPGFPVLGHLFGLIFAALGLAANWGGWLVVLAGYDLGAAQELLTLSPQGMLEKTAELAQERAVRIGGKEISGDALRGFWIGQAVLIALCGVFGGQSAWEIRRTRRRTERARGI